MTIPIVSVGQLINPATEHNAIAAQLNDLPLKIQVGYTGITTDATGYATITFPATMGAATYALSVTAHSTSSYYFSVSARTATTFTIRMHYDAGPVLSTSTNISWIAVLI